jgi:branched-chain amino acid transport system permease protein
MPSPLPAFALITLGLAVMFPALVRWKKLEWLTSGARGISGIAYDDVPQLPFVGDDSPREARAVFMYWLAVLALVVSYLVCRGLVKSRVGRSLIAIRDNETAAAVMGVDGPRTKTLAFGISASMCAVGGSMFAIRTNVVNPSDIQYFTLIGAIIFVVVMVLGGAATLWGPIVGSVVYIFLDKKTTEWGESDSGVMSALFGWMTGSPAPFVLAVVLIVMMFVAPFGIVGLLRRFASRFVVIVPAPAGASTKVAAAAAADPDLGEPVDPFDSNTTGGDQ